MLSELPGGNIEIMTEWGSVCNGGHKHMLLPPAGRCWNLKVIFRGVVETENRPGSIKAGFRSLKLAW